MHARMQLSDCTNVMMRDGYQWLAGVWWLCGTVDMHRIILGVPCAAVPTPLLVDASEQVHQDSRCVGTGRTIR